MTPLASAGGVLFLNAIICAFLILFQPVTHRPDAARTVNVFFAVREPYRRDWFRTNVNCLGSGHLISLSWRD
jgi:hypothetical protein